LAELQAALAEVSGQLAAESSRRDAAHAYEAECKRVAVAITNRFLRWRGGDDGDGGGGDGGGGDDDDDAVVGDVVPPPRAAGSLATAAAAAVAARAAVGRTLHPYFTVELPATPYRSPCPGAGPEDRASSASLPAARVLLRGLAGADRDRASLRVLGESLGRGTSQWARAMAAPALDK
jgi:hypothetical protein